MSRRRITIDDINRIWPEKACDESPRKRRASLPQQEYYDLDEEELKTYNEDMDRHQNDRLPLGQQIKKGD
jgi:hypothetical protein